MRRSLYIPAAVKTSIREHIQRATDLGVDAYLSAAEDEDVMTGHLGARLQIGPQRVRVTDDEIRGDWTWSLRYRKFRGRGTGAPEKRLGADGVFELTLDRGYRSDVKSLLFQAKMPGQGGPRLFEQCLKLSTWREAAFVLEYGPAGSEAIGIDDVVANRGSLAGVPRVPLAIYADSFVDCRVGDNDLRYDASASRLIWRSMSGEIVGVSFQVKHRFGLRVRPPQHGSMAPGVDRMIDPKDVHEFRMEVTDEDILGVAPSATLAEAKASHKRLALAYHPDRLASDDQLLRDIMNRRAQENNDAFARVKRQKQKGQ